MKTAGPPQTGAECVVLPNAFAEAAANMALDAALLERLPPACALFRHYGWIEPAATFGYGQAHAAISEHAPRGVTICRRLTGGGFVDHRNDWTYALLLGRSIEAARQRPTLLYTRLHQAVAAALAEQAIDTRLAPCPRLCAAGTGDAEAPPAAAAPSTASDCFAAPSADDVLRPDGRKIAGAAMKRSRQGLLIQGSIDRAALPDGFDYAALRDALPRQIADLMGLEVREREDIRPLFDGGAIEAHRRRFSSEAFLKRR